MHQEKKPQTFLVFFLQKIVHFLMTSVINGNSPKMRPQKEKLPPMSTPPQMKGTTVVYRITH